MNKIILTSVVSIGVAFAIGYNFFPDEKEKITIEQTPSESLRQLSQGNAKGFLAPNGTHMWLGIPFADAVSGERRWTLPASAKSWSGTREFDEKPEPCLQLVKPKDMLPNAGYIGVEDCLTLDISAPAFSSLNVPTGTDRLPVMVWIHGGGNTVGEPGNFADNLLVVEDNVIVVGLRYRVGPFGWFSHKSLRETGISSANFGLEDLIAALKWLQDNIEVFGGDPDNVTIFGVSAGAYNIFGLLVSPRSKGLFHRTIMQSGSSSTTRRTYAENSQHDPEPGDENNSSDIISRLLVADGMATDENVARKAIDSMPASEIVSFLRSRSALDLLTAYENRSGAPNYKIPSVIRDGFTIPFEEPYELITGSNSFNQVPVILGTNKDEQKIFLISDPEYTKWNEHKIPSMKDEVIYESVSWYTSRAWKYAGADRPADWLSQAGVDQVYVYRFDWDEEPMLMGSDLGKLVGAGHAIEIPFVFGQFDMIPYSDVLFNEANAIGREEVSGAMRRYWSNFARFGNPNGVTDSDLTAWTSRSLENGNDVTLVFDTVAGGGVRMASDRVEKPELEAALWEDTDFDLSRKCSLINSFVGFRGWTRKDVTLFGEGACIDDL